MKHKHLIALLLLIAIGIGFGVNRAMAVSASGTTIPSACRIVDSGSNIWTVISGVVYEDGTQAGATSAVALLLYYNGVVYQENTSGSWWSWNGTAWVATTDPRVSTVGEQAKMADSLVDSVGVNTHFGYTGTLWTTMLSTWIAAIESAGIRNLRDGAPFDQATYANITNTIAATGQPIYWDFLVNSNNSCTFTAPSSPPMDSVLQWTTLAHVRSFEGPNEIDGPGCSGAQIAAWQQNFWNYLKSVPSIASVPVFGLSLGNGQTNTAAIGNLTQWANYGNQHSYPPSEYPSKMIQWNLNFLNPMYDSIPWVATETGWHNDILCPVPNNCGFWGVSETAAGKMMSRLYLEYYNAGGTRVFVYDLLDEPYNASGADALGGVYANFGLIHTNGTWKPAMTAIANQNAILSDIGAAFTPGKLNYTLTAAPSTVHHSLFQKRNGVFYLVIWQEVDSYCWPVAGQSGHDCDGTVTSVDSPYFTGPVNLTLSFPAAVTNVTQYDPFTSKTAFSSVNSVSSLPIAVYDKALIIQVTP